MLSSQTLYEIAKCRFQEAEILLKNGKPDGAIYLSGYSIELMLKRTIVMTLNWDGYPASKKEFEGKTSFKIHDLNLLLNFSGLEKELQADTALYAKWQVASSWESESRYTEIGKVTDLDAGDTIEATREVLNFILAKSKL